MSSPSSSEKNGEAQLDRSTCRLGGKRRIHKSSNLEMTQCSSIGEWRNELQYELAKSSEWHVTLGMNLSHIMLK